MGALILACLLRAAPYLARLFWPVLASAVLAGLSIVVYRDASNGVLGWQNALVAFAGIAVGITACMTWAFDSIREYRRAEPPQPHL
ncbi:hypothetical protein [Glycomyces sp. NPDC021274]|uniref:hypothetical protein n=1 Tax=Glycomyces sp. NPDC021274 TaxID=3155120 RepID=UPI0033C29B34